MSAFRGLRLYDTLTREKRDFVPIDPENVRMYVCGPTVYDLAHIGNARPIIVFDVLFRLLRRLYGPEHVTYVRNITDVDDKINARAAQEGVSIRELTERTARQFHEDVAALGVLTADDVNPPGTNARRFIEPRATEHIEQMIAMIERLIEKGAAYVAEGHVLFDVSAKADYGKLSRRSLEEMVAGARVEVAPYKRGAMDFVLWKPSPPELPGWDSPWGRGRPGWHIECSAMSAAYLGEVFDIHAGGIDLVFPHHENEIAQSECAHGTPVMANYWLHNGFLQVEGEKMSKSLGNFVTIRDVLADWPGEVVRLAMLATHYRQPINWTVKGLSDAERALDAWYEAGADAGSGADADSGDMVFAETLEALLDDLNTPRAIASLHELRSRAVKGEAGAAARLRESAGLLGFLTKDAGAWEAARHERAGIDAAAVERLVAARLAARKQRNFAEADRIRAELDRLGVVVMDGKDPATGEPVTTWEVRR